MKVLILSCNTGEGHNSCAAALEEECRNQNIPCDTEDALRFISPEVSRFISNWHVRIYRHAPGLFRVGYRAAEDHPAQFHEGSALYRYLTQGAEKLCGFIAGSGYDTVICTHTFAALMVSEVLLHRHGLHLFAQREGQLARPLLYPCLIALGRFSRRRRDERTPARLRHPRAPDVPLQRTQRGRQARVRHSR